MYMGYESHGKSQLETVLTVNKMDINTLFTLESTCEKNRADREPEGTEQQQPTTTNNNQQLATTFNNQLQLSTTNNQQQQITNNILFLGAAWVSPGQFVHQSAKRN